MTLKEKFTTMVLDKDIADWEKECEQITNEFSIDFAKYVLINNGKYKYVDLEKMLKLFKKEKGL